MTDPALHQTVGLPHLVGQMCVIRHAESALLELFSRGMLNGTVHTCIGQEACAVGVISAIDKEKDIIFSNHRGHGHYLAYSDDLDGLLAEVMGKPEGVCAGVGGSQHLHTKNYYSNGIQGAGVPIAAGMALAEAQKKTDAIALAFIGDGTFGQGVIYEAFNIAALWQIPMLIVVEHNQYAQSTPSREQHAGNLATRALSFDIPVTEQDGMDVSEVARTSARLVQEVRDRSKPQMLMLHTYRFSPHSKGDDFRSKDEIESFRIRDPLMVAKNAIGVEAFATIDSAAKRRVDNVISRLAGSGDEP